MSMDKEQAITVLQKLISEIDKLKNVRAFSTEHTRWMLNAYEVTEDIFGKGSSIYKTLIGLPWRRTGSFLAQPKSFYEDPNEAATRVHHKAYLEQLETARGLLQAGIDQIKFYGIDKVHKSRDTEQESSELMKIINLADNKLRKTIRELPKQEKDIQDKFEDLLTANDIKYLREQERIPYSSKTYQPDFCFPSLNTALDLKLCDDKERVKTIIAEINDDIVAYRTKYSNIVFIVYDTAGNIRDADKFKEDIQNQSGVLVLVVKH